MPDPSHRPPLIHGRAGAPRSCCLLAVSLTLLAGEARARGPVEASVGPLRRHLPYRALPGVALTPEVEARILELAAAYHRKTRRVLVITSGTRSPEAQAAAMYRKLRRRRSLLRLYLRTDLALEIRGAYRKARRARAGRKQTIAAMAAVIKKQIERGDYISSHLRDGAVDIRSRGMRARHKRALRRLARALGGMRLIREERCPRHFHLELNLPRTEAPLATAAAR